MFTVVRQKIKKYFFMMIIGCNPDLPKKAQIFKLT